MQIKFNVSDIKLCTKTEGPYLRCCIWFQGCNLHCKGCCNKELQAFVPKHIITLEKLLDIVKEAKEKYNVEGITLSGGEPILQQGLSIFVEKVKDLGLGIIMFSGYEYVAIKDEILKNIDLLISGPFDINNIDNERVLIGSTNKKLIHLTDRYKEDESYFFNPISIEEVVAEDSIFINGD